MVACCVIGIFFLKFWKKTRDQLFLKFSIAFWLLGLERWLLLWINPADETRTYVYLVRLVAFTLIIFGIVEKNKTGGKTNS